MKMTSRILMLLAAAAVAFSCEKETESPSEVINDEEVLLTINASAPNDEETKTSLSGTTPSWSTGDKVSVVYKKTGESSWSKKASEALASGGSTASFTVSLTTPDTEADAYAYYPSNGLTASTDAVKVSIAATQNPTASSFDGNSDILISDAFKPISPVSAHFKRLGAVLKISLSNATLASEKLASLSLTGANNLAGDVQVTLSTATATGIVDNESKTVTASYVPANQFVVSGNYVYLIVYPQTLAKDSHLIVSGETSTHSFSKDITLSKDIVLKAGHIKPLNITLAAGDIAILPGDPLPFNGNLSSWVAAGTSEIDLDDTGGLFIDESKVYRNAAGELKFGSGSYTGSITTKYLDLSGPFKVIVSAKYYKETEAPKIKVTAGDATPKTSATATTASYADYEFDFDAGDCSSRACVKIETVEANRCYVNDIRIESRVPQLALPTNAAATDVDDDILVIWDADAEHADYVRVTCTGEADQDILPGVKSASFDDLATGIYTITVQSRSNDEALYRHSTIQTISNVIVGSPVLGKPVIKSFIETASGFSAEINAAVDYATSYDWALYHGSVAVGNKVGEGNTTTLSFNAAFAALDIDKFTKDDTYLLVVTAKASHFTSTDSDSASFVAVGAETPTLKYTLTPASTGGNTSPHNNYAAAATTTISGIGWSVTGNSYMVPWRIGGKSISNTERTVFSTTALGYNISKIEITHGAASSITVNSMTVIVSKNSDFSSPVSTLTPSFAANSTVTVNRPDGKDWSNCYYKIVYNVTVTGSSNKFVEFTEAKFTGTTATP